MKVKERESLFPEPGMNWMEELDKITDGTRISWTAKNRILDRYNTAKMAVRAIKANPYELITEIVGVGFTIADAIAANLGIYSEDPERIQAGILHTLTDKINSQGHTCVEEDYLIFETEKLLQVDEKLIQAQIGPMVEDGKLVDYDGKLTTKFLYMAEDEIAGKITDILACPNRTKHRLLEEKDNVGLYKDQVEAISQAVKSNVFILTGAPGTGKTFTIKTILGMYDGKYIGMCAPTGKAAKRMIEQTGKHAMTIHKILEPIFSKITGKFEFTRNSYNQLDHDIIIVDESSMLSTWLMYKLMDAIKPSTKLILVGDTYQLPPVGAGYILGDLLASGIVPSVELDIIKRQNPGLIIQNCHKIKDGEDVMTDLPNASGEKDFFFFKRNSIYDIKEEILDLMMGKLVEKYPEIDILRDVQIISPLNSKTLCSCDQLNEEIQEVFNPEPKVQKCNFKVGDKVIQTKNNYQLGIINGDIGYVKNINMKAKMLTVEFDPIETSKYNLMTMEHEMVMEPRVINIHVWKNELKLAYVITCHKFQGSENKIIIVPLHKSFGYILQRNWLYTAVSRAQKVLIMIGQKAETWNTIKRNPAIERNTNLKKFLKGE